MWVPGAGTGEAEADMGPAGSHFRDAAAGKPEPGTRDRNEMACVIGEGPRQRVAARANCERGGTRIPLVAARSAALRALDPASGFLILGFSELAVVFVFPTHGFRPGCDRRHLILRFVSIRPAPYNRAAPMLQCLVR